MSKKLMSAAALSQHGARLGDELSALRRRLHRIPEVGLMLPKTQAAILAELAGLDLEITLGERISSVTAVLRARNGKNRAAAI